jgi:FAD/FMN-containing dehydrogenase
MGLSFRSQLVEAWGRLDRPLGRVARPSHMADLEDADILGPRLAIGAARSYGDVGLSHKAQLIDMTGLDRFIAFDPETLLLRAQAGVTLDQILLAFAPLGYFLPVLPGTRHATLGGAVANDVHGKNHSRAGTFGCHVKALTLLRSDRGAVAVDPQTEPELFAGTVGGLGLTGIILDVTVALQPITSTDLDVETLACDAFDSLCDALLASTDDFEHVAAWIDCTSRGPALGRGILTRANWASGGPLLAHSDRERLAWPTDKLGSLINPLTLGLFNQAFYLKGLLAPRRSRSGYDPVFTPLDAIGHWNRLYGPRGFYQHQAVIPKAAGREPIRTMLGEIATSCEGSFLAVLKTFGSPVSPGLMSFPMEGLTLALDFPNRGEPTLALLSRLDRVVAEAGGRIYPAKDARMSRALFHDGYPNLSRFQKALDPACLSDFALRMDL